MKSLFVAALMAGVAGSAMAADLPTHKAPFAPAPMYSQPAFTWTGVYVGINGGYGFGDMSSSKFGNPSGGLVGGTLGYNYQMGQFVIGAEADLDWADLGSNNSFSTLASNKYHVNWMTTERLRLGYAVDRALFYVTGGYAGMSTHASIFDNSNNQVFGSQDKWRSGGVIGGGIEYAFTNNITAKAEYLWAPMQDETYWAGTNDAETNRMSVSLARVGLNFKF
jgi:outer membrane immunogenic protein